MFPRNPAYTLRMISIPFFAGLLVALWVTAADAADTKTTTTRHPDGSVEVCKYQTDFATTRDGANVIRTAWRCVRTPAK